VFHPKKAIEIKPNLSFFSVNMTSQGVVIIAIIHSGIRRRELAYPKRQHCQNNVSASVASTQNDPGEILNKLLLARIG